MKTIKEALWEIVRDENIIITNQKIDRLLDRASKKATGDAQALKESILERKGVIEDNIPPTLTNEEKVSEKDKLLLINEDKSNNFDVKSNKSQCIDCIHNDICQFYKALCANVICYPCGFYEAKSNEELFKQALVEGLNRHFDKTIEEAKKIEQIEELAKVIDYTFVLAEGVGAVRPSSRMIAMDLYDADFRKQSEGEWIKINPNNLLIGEYYCSCCNSVIDIADGKETPLDREMYYCPNCGSKMKGGE